ncbi:MAG: GNAT family N-acetyltransferase [Micropruina sp.]|nr:MAG: GNAT family N-acetyltransferase [Micropruina sp.]
MARRRGVASGLVADGLAWATEQGARRMLLEVEHTNVPALALYAGVGFAEIARRADYYAPGAHAIVMARELEAMR